MKKSTDQWDN